MEISAKFDATFILIPNVENKPGSGEEITASLYELGVDVKYFQATSIPGKEHADIMLMIDSGDTGRSRAAINRIRKKIKCGKPIIIDGLTGITIMGAGVKSSSKFLYRTLGVCAKLKINVTIAFTTLISINLYVEAKSFSPELVRKIEEALKPSLTEI